MSQLNQVIASLLSDINEAKSKADESSRNLARIYASDDVLKFFPVPKIGIQNLEVELKCAIESVEEKPFQSSQSKERLAAYMKNFSEDLAKELRIELSKESISNELYKGLGSYPSPSWEKNVVKLISSELESVTSSLTDFSRSIQKVQQNIQKSIPELVPIAVKSEGFAAVPTEKGSYELISFDKAGIRDFKVLKEYASEKEAILDANLISSSISSNKLVLSDFSKDPVSKLDAAKIKAGNLEVPIQVVNAKAASIAPKVLFEASFAEKAVLLKNPVRIQPWLVGRPAAPAPPTSPRPTSQPNQEEDRTLQEIASAILKKKMIQLEAGISKIAMETVSTGLQVAVDIEKLKLVKPENIMTIKFTLNSQDFTMLDDNSNVSIL